MRPIPIKERPTRVRVDTVGRLLSDGRLWTAAKLGDAVDVSIRTVNRYVAILRSRGLTIRGEVGVGYMMKGTTDGRQC